jgi:outer membrane protein assembly factor BamE
MFATLHQALRASTLIGIIPVLAACSSFNDASHGVVNALTPYQIDVVQGNVITSEQLALLRTGMDRNTVREVLGTPLLQSVFHSDRWDYVFTFRRKGQEPQQRKVVVFFKGNQLERFEADALPTEQEFVASLDTGRKRGKTPVLEADADALKKFDPATPSTASAAPAPAAPNAAPRGTPPDTYPPLESTTP